MRSIGQEAPTRDPLLDNRTISVAFETVHVHPTATATAGTRCYRRRARPAEHAAELFGEQRVPIGAQRPVARSHSRSACPCSTGA
jgi:hypothetical protein